MNGSWFDPTEPMGNKHKSRGKKGSSMEKAMASGKAVFEL